MRIREGLLVLVVCGALFVCGLVGPVLPSVAQQMADEPRQQTGFPSPRPIAEQQVNVSELPDSPGATLAQAQTPAFPQSAQPEAPQPSPNQTRPGDTQSNQPVGNQTANQPAANQPAANQPPTQRPVGTAAAEAPSTSGIAASEPAGVAIAPAKQRRARTIIIKTGAIIGAAVAVGVVVALTEGTSSKPPGAH
ncbi:MAG: hypothetical protein WCF22_16870 [Candidatus Sulfotelmatobacter sp.]